MCCGGESGMLRLVGDWGGDQPMIDPYIWWLIGGRKNGRFVTIDDKSWMIRGSPMLRNQYRDPYMHMD